MRSRRSETLRRTRAVVLALGTGGAIALAFASAALAAAPASGTACQATDGKVNGRGATFDGHQFALIPGYTTDVCGPVASDPDAGTNMIAYNYESSVSNSVTGSGNGQLAASCRTDAFAGTAIPYDQATLAALNAAPGSLAGGGCGAAFPPGLSPPFQPTPAPWPDTIAGQTDQTTRVMSFPVAGSSIAIGANFAPGDCGGNPPSSLNLTAADVSGIFGGRIWQWNDALLVTDNPGLATCDMDITRVVRSDKSGTTQILKNYLKHADPDSLQCDGTTFAALAQDANNTVWPRGNGCSPLARNIASGGPSLAATVSSIDGSIDYDDFGDWHRAALPTVLAAVANSNNSAFVSPGTWPAANCSFARTSLPGSSNSDAVGLSTSGLTWATDATPNKSDVTFRDTGYPICGFTWALVYSGLHTLHGTQAGNPITRLTNDQRQTLYSYFTYVLSPAAQSRLSLNGYAAIPSTFLTKLRLGFQANF